MEMIFKSEKSLNKIKEIRTFLLSDKWMVILFCLAGVITTLTAIFPGKDIEIIGTIVFVYIVGFCICISDDIMAGLAPFSMTSVVAIRCFDSFDTFMKYKWSLVPIVFLLLFHLIAYRKPLTMKGSQFKPMVFVSRFKDCSLF